MEKKTFDAMKCLLFNPSKGMVRCFATEDVIHDNVICFDVHRVMWWFLCIFFSGVEGDVCVSVSD